MPSDEEERLRTELATQLRESQKWFDKVRRINEVITSAKAGAIYVGGSKAPGLLGAALPFIGVPSGHITDSEVVRAIERILHEDDFARR